METRNGTIDQFKSKVCHRNIYLTSNLALTTLNSSRKRKTQK